MGGVVLYFRNVYRLFSVVNPCARHREVAKNKPDASQLCAPRINVRDATYNKESSSQGNMGRAHSKDGLGCAYNK